MAEIATTANEVYRDKEIDGVAASGAHKPKKAEIRALFATIDTTVADVAHKSNVETITGKKTMSGGITGLPAPTQDSDAATKAYADAIANGLKMAVGGAVRVATAAALPANTYANGSSGVGATLTSNSNGALAAVDGAMLVLNDRLWVKNEATASHNGLYYVSQVGSVSTPYILTRATDADAAADLGQLAAFVTTGSTYAGYTFAVPLVAASITVGSTSINPTIIDGPGGIAAEAAARGAADTAINVRTAGVAQDAPDETTQITDSMGVVLGQHDPDESRAGGAAFKPGPYELSVDDALGRVTSGFQDGRSMSEMAWNEDTGNYSPQEVAARDAVALGRSARLRAQFDTTSIRPNYDINVILVGGQSLSIGADGYPVLTKTQPFANIMLGGSINSKVSGDTTWQAVGGSLIFQPAVANVLDGAGNVLNDAAVLALGYSPPAGNRGEGLGVSCANMLTWLYSQHFNRQPVFLVINVGVTGKNIAQLSSGASPNYFALIGDAFTKAKTLATSAGKSIALTHILWVQGEADEGATAKDDYKDALIQWRDDVEAQAVAHLSNPSGVPVPIFTHQPGGLFGASFGVANVETALAELPLEQPNWYNFGPIYGYTNVSDTDGHMPTNGHRWAGCQAAKCMFQATGLGRNPLPNFVDSVTVRGRTVLMSVNLDTPPVQRRQVYATYTSLIYDTLGIDFRDDLGVVAVAPDSVQIAGDATIIAVLGREPSGDLIVRGGDYHGGVPDHQGRINVADSDPTVAFYAYMATSTEITAGMNPAAAISELNQHPYPLNNFLQHFEITATPD